jgi:hypothetical protein
MAALLAFLALFWVLGKHLEGAVERRSMRGQDAV